MKNLLNGKIIYFAVILISFLLLIPLFISILLNLDIFSFALGSTDSWISFWGSYIGGGIGMIAVIATTLYIVKEDSKANKDIIEIQKTQFEQQITEQRDQFESQLTLQKEHFEKQLMNQTESLRITDANERNRIYLEIIINETSKLIEIITKIASLTNDFYVNIKDMYQVTFNIKNEKNPQTADFFEQQYLVASKREYELFLALNELSSIFITKINFLENTHESDNNHAIYRKSREFKNKFIDTIQDTHFTFKRWDGSRDIKSQEETNLRKEETDEIGQEIIYELNLQSDSYQKKLVYLINKLNK